MKTLEWAVVLSIGTLSAAAAAESVGPAAEVAPNVQETRQQMWPRAAWSKGAKSWLVAWREGCINEGETDIFCARVSADGKALDPAGILVARAKDRQERPGVASDGKGFLVVWEDFRNGKDYDVYAARVSVDGKVLDEGGFPVATGAHNQCRPVVAFAGGSYYVAWQAFRGDGVPGNPGTGYVLYGARVSPAGKVLDPGGVLVTDASGKAHADNAVAAAMNGRVLVGHLIASHNGTACILVYAGIASVDAASGRSAGKPHVMGPSKNISMYPGFPVDQHRLPALAMGKRGGLFAAPNRMLGLYLWRLDANGKETGPPQMVVGAKGLGLVPLFTLAFDGEKYLLTLDQPVRRGREGVQVKVFGYYLEADGKLPGDRIKDLPKTFFVIAGDGDKDQMQGFAAAGPKGACLVAYVEVRGVDDCKVLARVVRAK